MQRKRLGTSGLLVSELAFGCMSFGETGRGPHAWTLGLDAARPIFRRAVEAGIDIFDTSNSYADGTSEEVLGTLIAEHGPRHQYVVATKVFGGGPEHLRGLSRRSILAQIDLSLTRLRTDYIDLYQIHRWDPVTPIEETMEALNDLVRAGKVRYLGASTMFAWQFAKAQEVARRHGRSPFISMQNQLNLIYREEEREMNPLCFDQGVGLLPWSPLGRGRLARPWGSITSRSTTDAYARRLYAATLEADRPVVEALEAMARHLGRSMAHVALAWVRQQPGVVAPIIGTTSMAQLDDLLAGLDLKLDAATCAALEAPYVPHVPVGHD